MPRQQQDHTIGRERGSNEEIDDAPESAHVKRTAQESFEPEAFVLRRSMPWAEGNEGGLVFTAFGHSLDAFEAQLRRMSGAEDGITEPCTPSPNPKPAPISGACRCTTDSSICAQWAYKHGIEHGTSEALCAGPLCSGGIHHRVYTKTPIPQVRAI